MISHTLREILRRKDIGCAQRARWLGVRKPSAASDYEAAMEHLRRAKEQIRQPSSSPDNFNRR